jgi:hypothetical protein
MPSPAKLAGRQDNLTRGEDNLRRSRNFAPEKPRLETGANEEIPRRLRLTEANENRCQPGASRGSRSVPKAWTPAFAGMTGTVVISTEPREGVAMPRDAGFQPVS